MNLDLQDYPTIESITDNDGLRRYPVNGTNVLSVTTILSMTMPDEKAKGLKNWRKGIGEKEATRQTERASNVGTKMHDMLEQYVLYGTKPNGPYAPTMMARKMIQRGLNRIDTVIGVESQLYQEGLYAGTCDLIAYEDDKLKIIDYKNASYPRSEEEVEDYYLQLCAYAIAHDTMKDTNIRNGSIKLMTRHGQYQEFSLDESNFDYYCDKWFKRLEQCININKIC